MLYRRSEGQALEARRPIIGKSRLWIWVFPLAAGIVCLLAFAQVREFRNGRRSQNREQQAFEATQHFIKQRFEPGVRLRYPSRDWTRVESTSEGYRVTGWVEAISLTGATAGVYDFTCLLSQNLDGQWYASRLDLVAQ
jgi:hypothetical protein